MRSVIALVCLITSLSFATGKPPLRISDGEGAHATLLTVKNYTYTVKEKELAVAFQFERDDARRLAEISRHFVGKHLALAVGDSAASTPEVRDALDGNGIWVSFADHQSLEAMEKALAGNR